jgi:hypothetical protein
MYSDGSGARIESTAVSLANNYSTALTTENGDIDYCINVGSVVCSLNYIPTNERAALILTGTGSSHINERHSSAE